MHSTLLFTVVVVCFALVIAETEDEQQTLCNRKSDCDSCLLDPDCGWCKFLDTGNGRCTPGGEFGPGTGTCASFNRTWFYYSCPASSSTGNPFSTSRTTSFSTTRSSTTGRPFSTTGSFSTTSRTTTGSFSTTSRSSTTGYPYTTSYTTGYPYTTSFTSGNPNMLQLKVAWPRNYYSNCTGLYSYCGNNLRFNFTDPTGQGSPKAFFLKFVIFQKSEDICNKYYAYGSTNPIQSVLLNGQILFTNYKANLWNCHFNQYCTKQPITFVSNYPTNYRGNYGTNTLEIAASIPAAEFCVEDVHGEVQL